VLVEDGQERTVGVVENGFDTEWQTLLAESQAEQWVQLELVNRISGWQRSLLIDSVGFTVLPTGEE
jgi:hypothetical protein